VSVSVTTPMVEVHAPLAVFDGIVECQTLVANTLVARRVHAGRRNIW